MTLPSAESIPLSLVGPSKRLKRIIKLNITYYIVKNPNQLEAYQNGHEKYFFSAVKLLEGSGGLIYTSVIII